MEVSILNLRENPHLTQSGVALTSQSISLKKKLEMQEKRTGQTECVCNTSHTLKICLFKYAFVQILHQPREGKPVFY